MAKFFATMDKLRPIYDATDKIVMTICKLLLIADICISGYSVLGRYVPFISDPSWTEEVVLTLMSYMAVLSAAIAIRHKSHIRMDAFDRYIPKPALHVLNLLSDIAVLALGVIMLVIGMQYAMTIGARGTYVSMPSVSRFWMYFPVPLAGIAMIVFELECIYEEIRDICLKKEGV